MTQSLDDVISLIKRLTLDEKKELLSLLEDIIEDEDPYIMCGGIRIAAKRR